MAVTAQRNRHLTSGQVAKELHTSAGTTNLWQTVSMLLNDIGLYAWKPVKCIPLTPDSKHNQCQCCREYTNWTDQQWNNVLFMDESRFGFSSDSRCQYIWHEPSTAFNAKNIFEVHQYRSGIMVWVRIMSNCCTDLMVLERGAVTTKRCCEEVLVPYVFSSCCWKWIHIYGWHWLSSSWILHSGPSAKWRHRPYGVTCALPQSDSYQTCMRLFCEVHCSMQSPMTFNKWPQ